MLQKACLTLTILMSIATIVVYSILISEVTSAHKAVSNVCNSASAGFFACKVSFPGPVTALVMTVISMLIHAVVLYLQFKKNNKYYKYSRAAHIIGTLFMCLGLCYLLGFEVSVSYMGAELAKQKVEYIQYHFYVNIATIVLSIISLILCLVDHSVVLKLKSNVE